MKTNRILRVYDEEGTYQGYYPGEEEELCKSYCEDHNFTYEEMYLSSL